MKYIKKFNEDNNVESSLLSDEEIMDYFTDYTDANKESVKIINGYIDHLDVFRETETPEENIDKLIKVIVGNAGDIMIGGGGPLDGYCLQSLDPLKKAVDDINRFYQLTGSDVNYSIGIEVDELCICFLLK